MKRDRRARGWVGPSLAVGVAMVVLGGVHVGGAEPPRSAGESVMAEVGDEVITSEVVRRALGSRLHRLEQQLYVLQRKKLDELINQKLLEREAARRGISVERLFEIEVKTKVRVTDQEVEAFYRERKDSVSAREAAVKAVFKQYLEQQKLDELLSRFVEKLRSGSQVRIYLEEPAPITADYLTIGGAAVKGPQDALVTIVEFSDFQCPFCAKAQAVLQQVLDTYPTQVKLVYRHFPVAAHPQASLAAEAAECAAGQGKFWEYHAQLFASASDLSPARLKALAGQLRLDLQGFATCLDTGQVRARVAQDLADGREAGVTGTPTFFINGRVVEGAQPFVTFKRTIDQELALRGPSRNATQR